MMAVKREGGGGEEPPFSPTEAWINAFEDQASVPDFIERMQNFARQRAGLVALNGRRVDDYYVKSLVQDVLDDTVLGKISWDHGRVSLEKHVMDAIQSRTRHQYVHDEKFRHQSLEDLGPRGRADLERALSTKAALAAEREAARQLAAATLIAIRELTQDPEILLLVDAYEHELSEKAEVLEHTGLTRAQYRAAKKRFRALLELLPSYLQRRGSR